MNNATTARAPKIVGRKVKVASESTIERWQLEVAAGAEVDALEMYLNVCKAETARLKAW